MYDMSWNANIGGNGWGIVITDGQGYGGYYPGTGIVYPNQTVVSGQTNQILLIGAVIIAAIFLMK
jgi:hypothetical protein